MQHAAALSDDALDQRLGLGMGQVCVGDARHGLAPFRSFRFRPTWLPLHQALLAQADDVVQRQRERRQHHDAREHGVHIESALGLQDQVAHAAGRTQVLAHHRAHEGQADGGVQAGEHPAGGGRQVHVAQQLAAARAQHARVVQQRGADLAHALVDVEEHDEEHQRHGQRHLGPDAQAEPHAEDGRQDHARHRVGRLDVGIQDRAGQRRQPQPQPAPRPAAVPMKNASTVSVSVTHRCV